MLTILPGDFHDATGQCLDFDYVTPDYFGYQKAKIMPGMHFF